MKLLVLGSSLYKIYNMMGSCEYKFISNFVFIGMYLINLKFIRWYIIRKCILINIKIWGLSKYWNLWKLEVIVVCSNNKLVL